MLNKINTMEKKDNICIRNCLYCGAQFTATVHNKIYCSSQCLIKATLNRERHRKKIEARQIRSQKRKWDIRECPTCKVLFSTYIQKDYCSEKCNHRFYLLTKFLNRKWEQKECLICNVSFSTYLRKKHCGNRICCRRLSSKKRYQEAPDMKRINSYKWRANNLEIFDKSNIISYYKKVHKEQPPEDLLEGLYACRLLKREIKNNFVVDKKREEMI